MWRVCAAATLCVVASMIVKACGGSLAVALRIAATVLIFGMLIPSMGDLASELAQLFAGDGVARYASVLVRTLGVAVLTQLCGDVCRDCGETATAQGVEMAGKVTIVALCIPLLKELAGYASALLQGE